MTSFDNEPEDSVGPIGPMGSGRRRRKPSGGAQAITMIFAWGGGAVAAVAVAFWLLQYIKPGQDPKQEVVEQAAIAKKEDSKKKSSRAKKQERAEARRRAERRAEQKAVAVEPVAAKPMIDLANFQRPTMPGMAYRYYDGETFGMADFSTASASRSGLLVDVGDLPNANAAKGLRLEGYWETRTHQPCTFLMDSTNGARLWIDDELVLDNTAQFQREPVEASRMIQPGMHAVRVEFVLSTEGGSYKLEVGAKDDPQRMNLARLLQPFGLKELTSLDSLQYELANYDKPGAAIKALIESNREAVEAGFIETVSAKPVVDDDTAKVMVPEGCKLLAGLAVGSSQGRVAAAIPIYLDDSGLSLGAMLGSESQEWESLIAEPGFAVSALQIEQFNSADDVSLEFRRIGNQSLLPTDAYTHSIGSQPVDINVSDECQPVIGLRVNMANASRLVSVDAMRVRSGESKLLAILADGFPVPSSRKKAPSPNEIKQVMKKLMKESAARLSGTTGRAQEMELKALAESTAISARDDANDESRFISLLEARRLHLLAGEIRPAFAITHELSQEFEYDYWSDQLALFRDATQRAGKSPIIRRKVMAELGPEISKAEESFRFEVAGKLAAGGKMLATELNDQSSFAKFSGQLEEFERSAMATKQARAAAKTLTTRPDDAKANRSLGVFNLVVTHDWDQAMEYFARSSNQDCEFIAAHDRSFDGADAQTAMKLAKCWMRTGKKNEALEKLAAERAQQVLTQAKTQAVGKDLKDIESDLERL